MTNQLTLFKLSKEELLLNWCKQKGYFSKAEVMQYGLDNHYIRAPRTIQDWVQHKKNVRRLDKEECLFR